MPGEWSYLTGVIIALLLIWGQGFVIGGWVVAWKLRETAGMFILGSALASFGLILISAAVDMATAVFG